MAKRLFLILFLALIFSWEQRAQATTTFTRPVGDLGLGNTTGKDGGMAWGDYDGDGCLDVIFNTETSSGAYLYRGNCSVDPPSYTNPQTFSGVFERSVVWGDFDNDGDLDFARNTWTTVQIWRNGGGVPPFSLYTTISSIPGGTNTEGLGWIDYDADGDLDLLIESHNFGVDLYQNAGSPTFSFSHVDPTTIGLPTSGIEGDYLAVADYDVDGDVDFLARKEGVTDNDAQSDLWANNGGSFTRNSSFNQDGEGGNKGGVVFCDFDNDGDFDIYWTDGLTNTLALQGGVRTGNYAIASVQEKPPTTGMTNIDGVTCGDVDNDADLDLFLTDSDADFLFINQLELGSLSWTQDNGGVTGSNNGEAAVFADINRDGDLDLYINSDGSNEVWLNNLNTTNYLMVHPLYNAASAGTGTGTRAAFGATVVLTECDGSAISGIREVNGGKGHGSQDPASVHFGLGSRDLTLPLVAEVKFVGGQMVRRAVVPDALSGYQEVSVSTSMADNLLSCDLDFGDLPASYGNTTFSDDGARHAASALRLGAAVTSDVDGQEDPNANGDANDDGVTPVGNWSDGAGEFDIDVNGAGCLNAWLDFTDGLTAGRDNDFNDSLSGNSEYIVQNQAVDAATGTINFPLPLDVADFGDFFLRVRLTPRDADTGCASAEAYTGGAASPLGQATGGEVEDYHLLFTPTAISMKSFTARAAPGASLWLLLPAASLLLLALLYRISVGRK